MRHFLIIISLLAFFSTVYSRKPEKKEKFVIVVNDNDDQNTTSSVIENTVKPAEKNIVISRYKSKRNDFKKKFINNSNTNDTKNITDPKVMFKFEAKDGRMKFQRDVDESKAPESQTESYEPITYETAYKSTDPITYETAYKSTDPITYETAHKSTETPTYTYSQYPATYYRLCPVHYTGNHAENQGYSDHQSAYHQPAILFRSPKQLVQYAPISDSFTSYTPSNYESGLDQQHQYLQNQQTYGNNPSYGYQIYHPTYNGQQSFYSGSEQENIYGYGNAQNNYITHNFGSDNKFKSPYYTDYNNGIDANQPSLNGIQQSYVYVPNYDSSQNSQYYTTNYNTDGSSQYNNIYSNSYSGYAPEFGNGYNQSPQGSFVDPATGSYQINVGNKYTDTSSSNKYAFDANKNSNVNYQNADNQITQVKYLNTLGTNTNIALNHYQSNLSGNNVLPTGNQNYYSYNSNYKEDKSNPSVFESLKINVINQQTQPKI